MKQATTISPIWGGRFVDVIEEAVGRINSSIDFDRRLWREDIIGSKAHVEMLVAQRIITEEDGYLIAKALEEIAMEIDSGAFKFLHSLEDIHLNIEHRLHEKIGDAAGRLHTARSRNDQIALDMKLWIRGVVDLLDDELKELQIVLIERADQYAETIMPGFTHLQPAQPITFGHHLMAYVEMFGRDRTRLADARRRMNENPLGAAALAGTQFPIDRHMTSAILGFDRPSANSIDAVSDRDFVMEVLACAGICAVHLSRLAEELIIWTTSQFSFVHLSDSLTTGSSIMPQKKNPDGAELVKGKTGRIVSAFTIIAIVLKGMPLSYGKDMQEDKEPCFDAIDNLRLCITCITSIVRTLQANQESMRKAVFTSFITATDLADWLVRETKMPFRNAHYIVGQVVRAAEERCCGLADLPLDLLRKIHHAFDEQIYKILSVDVSLNARTSYGGTAPVRVREQIVEARKRFLNEDCLKF
ncbi:argininosuccinate lyase [Candidatus Endolissoclinum faulkneri L2]|uniref:Argininosuccinate lyase n=1 Tax=Candidatus Endolissoclinum faulkneri L2 TaxID=1193729 RepID=K7YQJ8_9PROT|nr:argininosuccinate lyase [Candidatus Endolissoclinum faulkneri]AFX98824.1 argininosuccinate lyase [Candidatus Endolissoclinum faulkneri L2]